MVILNNNTYWLITPGGSIPLSARQTESGLTFSPAGDTIPSKKIGEPVKGFYIFEVGNPESPPKGERSWGSAKAARIPQPKGVGHFVPTEAFAPTYRGDRNLESRRDWLFEFFNEWGVTPDPADCAIRWGCPIGAARKEINATVKVYRSLGGEVSLPSSGFDEWLPPMGDSEMERLFKGIL